MKFLYGILLFALSFINNPIHAQTIDTLVSVGNHRLHFNIVKGSGVPILFESGNGDDGSTWKDILDPIHASTGATLITYDRAGLGKSGIDTTRLSFQQEVRDLKQGLKALGFEGDYFIVAHSFGSLYASEFANLHQGKIKGAVFIDVSTPCNLHQEYTTRVKQSISPENWKMLKQYKAGLFYVLDQLPEIADYMSDRYLSDRIPMTVIVAEHYKPTPQIGETEQDMSKRKTCLKALGNLPNHTYVVAKGSDHKVWVKAPEVVVKEVAKLYKRIQEQ